MISLNLGVWDFDSLRLGFWDLDPTLLSPPLLTLIILSLCVFPLHIFGAIQVDTLHSSWPFRNLIKECHKNELCVL